MRRTGGSEEVHPDLYLVTVPAAAFPGIVFAPLLALLAVGVARGPRVPGGLGVLCCYSAVVARFGSPMRFSLFATGLSRRGSRRSRRIARCGLLAVGPVGPTSPAPPPASRALTAWSFHLAVPSRRLLAGPGHADLLPRPNAGRYGRLTSSAMVRSRPLVSCVELRRARGVATLAVWVLVTLRCVTASALQQTGWSPVAWVASFLGLAPIVNSAAPVPAANQPGPSVCLPGWRASSRACSTFPSRAAVDASRSSVLPPPTRLLAPAQD
jgi:hypothetical protein